MVSRAGKGVERRRVSGIPDQTPATEPAQDGGATERRDRQRAGGGIPHRALADGVVERRRNGGRGAEAGNVPVSSRSLVDRPYDDHQPPELTAREHYQLERQRRADKLTGDLATLLEEAKAEYEAQINAPRPAGKGGRPRKKPVVADDDDL